MLQDDGGHVIDSIAGVEAGSAVSVRVADGRVLATTTSTESEPTAHDEHEESA